MITQLKSSFVAALLGVWLLALPFGMVASPAAGAPASGGAVAPNALVILTSPDIAAMHRTIQALEAQGTRIVHVFPPTALIGHIPPGLNLDHPASVAAVYDSWVNEAEVAGYGPAAQQAAYVWNHNVVRPAPPPPAPSSGPFLGDRQYVDRPANAPSRLDGAAPGYTQTSEFMAGRIAVGIILPESTGALDPSTENWTPQRMNRVVSEIQAGLDWWSQVNPNGHLSFYYDIHYQVPTQYEPITHPYFDDHLWIAETLATLGYSGGDWVDQTYAYLNSLRTRLGTDWAVVALVADSLNDTDGAFADGYSAYTYGFLIVLTYDNGTWTIYNMDSALAHEFAHDFGAEDEYCTPGIACCSCSVRAGYLGILNSMCDAGCDLNGNGKCDGDDATPHQNCRGCPSCIETTCLMRYGLISAGLDTPSKEQVGIRDTDHDGILDPVDTTPAVTLTLGTAPRSWITPLTGAVADEPYKSPTRPAVTINHITAVEFQVDDDGVWRPARAADGAFNEPAEDYVLSLPPLSSGPHPLAVRATNRAGNSSTLSTTLVLDLAPRLFLPLALK